jgi:homoserine dehydrogenase
MGLKAIENGKHIVSANKALLAVHGGEIYAAAARNGVEVLYEAAVGGGIPVISAIKGNMAANNFTTVLGILNGTCNYILTKMTQEGADFAQVLKRAQELGYAEADRPRHRGQIPLKALHPSIACFGTRVDFTDIRYGRITSISADIDLPAISATRSSFSLRKKTVTGSRRVINHDLSITHWPTDGAQRHPPLGDCCQCHIALQQELE